MREYLAAIGPLLQKYGKRDGTPYRIVVAAYPSTASDEGSET